MVDPFTIILDPNRPDTILNKISPFLLVIDPQYTSPSSKVYKIEYIFGDNTPNTVNRLYYSSYNDINLPFPAEPGDPRNYPVSHLFLSQNSSDTYNFEIRVFPVENQTITENYDSYNVTLHLRAPSLIEDHTKQTNFFESVHLVNTRMFGPDNTILYNFESANPQYLLPTVVKWHLPYNTSNPAPFVFDPLSIAPDTLSFTNYVKFSK